MNPRDSTYFYNLFDKTIQNLTLTDQFYLKDLIYKWNKTEQFEKCKKQYLVIYNVNE